MTVPSYTPTNWENSPSTATPLDAVNLNHAEAGIGTALGRANDAHTVATGNQAYADAKALTGVEAVKIADGTAVVGKHNPIDASGGARTVTLPSATGIAGSRLVVEKTDTSPNTVTISGSIRGAAATEVLSVKQETIELLSDGATWYPVSGRLPKTSLGAPEIRERIELANASALMPFWAALANRANKRCNIVHMGTSVVEGYPATSWANQQPAKLCELLRARFPTPGLSGGGRGFIGSARSSGMTWPIVPTGTGGTTDTTHGYGAKFGCWYAISGTAGGPKITDTLDAAITSFDIHFIGGPNGNAAGGSYKIDAAAAVNFDTTNPTVDLWKSLHVASAATTAIEIAWNAGYLFPGGIVEYNGDENKGIQVHNCGWGGSRAGSWLGATAAAADRWDRAMALLDPDLIVLELGANEHIQDIASATYRTDLVSLVAMIRAAGMTCPILLSSAYDVESATYAPYLEPWVNYTDAMRAVATADPTLAFVDHAARMPSTVAADTLGLYHSDQVHGNANGAGHSYMAESVFAAIAPR